VRDPRRDERSRALSSSADGEGAEHVVDVVVEGASDDAAADTIARADTGSVLFRCAVGGADPNWGRIVCAIGNSGVDCDVDAIAIDVDDVALVATACSCRQSRARWRARSCGAKFIRCAFASGAADGKATIVTSDLTAAYVRFNSRTRAETGAQGGR
jgi:glutamate N-acetyltransferase/amino-acid N-acetyltransferase